MTNLIDLKERIAIADLFTQDERMFILAAVNAVVEATNIVEGIPVHNPPNRPGRIETLWAALSIDDNGEGLCAAPMGDLTMPLVTANRLLLDKVIIPMARHIAKVARKPVRLVKFTKREDVELYRADGNAT